MPKDTLRRVSNQIMNTRPPPPPLKSEKKNYLKYFTSWISWFISVEYPCFSESESSSVGINDGRVVGVVGAALAIDEKCRNKFYAHDFIV